MLAKQGWVGFTRRALGCISRPVQMGAQSPRFKATANREIGVPGRYGGNSKDGELSLFA
jgi:hypothetical protein